jgi:serine/threonine protein kinase
MQLSGYSLVRLRDNGEFILYRAYPTQTELSSVLLLVPFATHPSPETLKKIDHEYSLRRELNSAWAVRPLALSERDGQATLVFEDPGGETLDGFLSGPMQMTQFLGLAVDLATALGGLHERKLIHKDVKPSNILVNSATGQLRLMGFGIASRLQPEHPIPEPPEFIAGTLPYMAPEQTGRMNRSIDSRSDLYVLGVTLYEVSGAASRASGERAGPCLCNRDEVACQDSRGTLSGCVRRRQENRAGSSAQAGIYGFTRGCTTSIYSESA